MNRRDYQAHVALRDSVDHDHARRMAAAIAKHDAMVARKARNERICQWAARALVLALAVIAVITY